jgi:hypothetical protein
MVQIISNNQPLKQLLIACDSQGWPGVGWHSHWSAQGKTPGVSPFFFFLEKAEKTTQQIELDSVTYWTHITCTHVNPMCQTHLGQSESATPTGEHHIPPALQ